MGESVLELLGYVELPAHVGRGAFDHAAVHGGRGLLYVAHTANDAVDVIDCATNRYLRSIPDLPAVAGALVSEAHDLVFTSNRGENTVGIFCAGDAKTLLVVDSRSGAVASQHALSGPPDVVFLNARLQHLYVAIGDPGVIDVFDIRTMRRVESVPTERGAHTIGFDAARDTVYAFLPDTHRAAVYRGR
jgi:DNA-binding beta-propeller fold protein YncE